MPEHAGRLRPLERCVFTAVFALMASFVVVMAFMATTSRWHLLLTGPSVGTRTVAAGLSRPQPVEAPDAGLTAGAARPGQSDSGASAARHPNGATGQALDARLAAALRPVLGRYAGRLAVGVIDLRTGATASYDGGVPIRGGGVVVADILATLLLQHQQAGTPVSNREAELAAAMIENGSTPAATQLWSMVGGAAGLAAANATLKLHGTIPAPGDWTWTRTTVADQLQLLADLVEPSSPLRSAARDYALGLMADAVAGDRWGVPAAASAGTAEAGTDGKLVGPAWVVGSIGVIQRDGDVLLVAVLSDRNPAEAPAVTAVQAAAVAAAGVVG
ncbi:MAG TPA: hypothetical protein VEJ42_10015 [Streptosporangiaceae bacterium]|nr:hypothetical protein [Streptosporangiaceae bacterium]